MKIFCSVFILFVLLPFFSVKSFDGVDMGASIIDDKKQFTEIVQREIRALELEDIKKGSAVILLKPHYHFSGWYRINDIIKSPDVNIILSPQVLDHFPEIKISDDNIFPVGASSFIGMFLISNNEVGSIDSYLLHITKENNFILINIKGDIVKNSKEVFGYLDKYFKRFLPLPNMPSVDHEVDE